MTTKEALHRLIDDLTEEDLLAAERLLVSVRDRTADPLRLTLLTAPFDDEEETAEERAAVEEAREQVIRGEVIADDELWRQLDGTPTP